MANIYTNKPNIDNLENKALVGIGGVSAGAGGLAGVLAGFTFLPGLGIFGGAALAIWGIGRYIYNKYNSNVLDTYLKNSEKGDVVEARYKIDRKGNVKVILPHGAKLSPCAQTYLDNYLKLPVNHGYKMIIENMGDGKYRFANALLNNAGGAATPVNMAQNFDFDTIKYQDYSRQKKSKKNASGGTEQKTSATKQEVLAKLRKGSGGSNESDVATAEQILSLLKRQKK